MDQGYIHAGDRPGYRSRGIDLGYLCPGNMHGYSPWGYSRFTLFLVYTMYSTYATISGNS